MVDAPDLEALGTVLHTRLTTYIAAGVPKTERTGHRAALAGISDSGVVDDAKRKI